MSAPSGTPETVEIQVDAEPVSGPIDPRVESNPAKSVRALIADLEPIWPPEPGMLVEVIENERIGEVRSVAGGQGGRVRIHVRMTDATTGKPDFDSPEEVFDSEDLAAL
jgi:hypothetical protein